MSWIKKHVDTVIILGGILSAVFWMNGRFNEVDNRFNQIETRLTRIETYMILKNIMPREMAALENK